MTPFFEDDTTKDQSGEETTNCNINTATPPRSRFKFQDQSKLVFEILLFWEFCVWQHSRGMFFKTKISNVIELTQWGIWICFKDTNSNSFFFVVISRHHIPPKSLLHFHTTILFFRHSQALPHRPQQCHHLQPKQCRRPHRCSCLRMTSNVWRSYTCTV